MHTAGDENEKILQRTFGQADAAEIAAFDRLMEAVDSRLNTLNSIPMLLEEQLRRFIFQCHDGGRRLLWQSWDI